MSKDVLLNDNRQSSEQIRHTMTIFVSSGRDKKTNTSYPFEAEISSTDDLKILHGGVYGTIF